eukprot:Nitzschia sp. Nitz4//scaffold353_size16344//8893//9208//NITZ4_008863-RA/size16344-snap-gene-0.19-mRNA-1//-1//CDS//3329548919//8415//frame0
MTDMGYNPSCSIALLFVMMEEEMGIHPIQSNPIQSFPWYVMMVIAALQVRQNTINQTNKEMEDVVRFFHYDDERSSHCERVGNDEENEVWPRRLVEMCSVTRK